MAIKVPSTRLRGVLKHINPKLKFDPKPFDRSTVGKLKADVAYVSAKRGSKANYLYTTDSAGRIKSVTADPLVLKPKGQKRGSYTYKNPAGKTGLDDSGHLIGDRFDGAGGRENIVAQLSATNQGAWKQMEERWARALEANPGSVSVEVEVIYGPGGRPVGFNVAEWIDGKYKPYNFSN
jgi:hypothetical protein